MTLSCTYFPKYKDNAIRYETMRYIFVHSKSDAMASSV